jgi:hypothetical protein
MSTPSSCPVGPRPFWGPLRAGLSLGAVLLLTFMLTGHGLGATGFTTRLTAWLGATWPRRPPRPTATWGPCWKTVTR